MSVCCSLAVLMRPKNDTIYSVVSGFLGFGLAVGRQYARDYHGKMGQQP